MRHLKKGRKFGRLARQRKALLRNLAAALIEKRKITTTAAKAKELRPFVEQLITSGKIKTAAAIRKLYAILPERSAKKIMASLEKHTASRQSGYTRIIKLGRRKSDGAEMAIIEFVD
ncbi:MAG: 50S ribosomal protein L17 [Candidatus Sungbacteria bacterium]|nr:50S ribosomal protein L17 [Candidatus Sungbacteria bacterium]